MSAGAAELTPRQPRGRVPGSNRISPSVLERARAMLAEGSTLRQAATAVGVAKSTLAQQLGPTGAPRGRRPGVTPEQKALIFALRDGGASIRRIARETGLPKRTVERWLTAPPDTTPAAEAA